MNKILLYTDNHFCSVSSILRGRGTKYSLRLENQLDTMNWLIELAKEQGCTDIVSLGDFFDKPELNAEELACLSEIDFQNLNCHFLVGNHEMGNATLEYSSAHSFLINQNCEVYNKPAIIGIGNTLIYILPYQLEVNRLNDIMEYFPKINIPNNIQYKILLTHNDIAGVNMGMFISKEGFSKDNLDNNFDLIINGHLHNQQWVTKKILNLGNITGQNFSEDATKYKHQCMILDCDTLQHKLITNPYALNFSKLDFTGKYDNIDYINKMSPKIGNNAVVSIKTNSQSFDYINKRFNPDIPEDKLIPRNCNVIQARILIERELLNEDNSSTEQSISTLQLNHLNEFQSYVLANIGSDELVISELQEILQ